MVGNEQIASLERIRATRDDAAVTAALNALTHAAQHNENLQIGRASCRERV